MAQVRAKGGVPLRDDHGALAQDFLGKPSHGHVERDFDVGKWAAPEFLETAAKELVQGRRTKFPGDKVPTPGVHIG